MRKQTDPPPNDRYFSKKKIVEDTYKIINSKEELNEKLLNNTDVIDNNHNKFTKCASVDCLWSNPSNAKYCNECAINLNCNCGTRYISSSWYCHMCGVKR
jgi:hypothetical protein